MKKTLLILASVGALAAVRGHRSGHRQRRRW